MNVQADHTHTTHTHTHTHTHHTPTHTAAATDGLIIPVVMAILMTAKSPL